MLIIPPQMHSSYIQLRYYRFYDHIDIRIFLVLCDRRRLIREPHQRHIVPVIREKLPELLVLVKHTIVLQGTDEEKCDDGAEQR